MKCKYCPKKLDLIEIVVDGKPVQVCPYAKCGKSQFGTKVVTYQVKECSCLIRGKTKKLYKVSKRNNYSYGLGGKLYRSKVDARDECDRLNYSISC